MKLFYGQIFPEVTINEEEQLHITKVLRLKDGEAISITDGKGNLANGILKLEGKKALLIEIEIIKKENPFTPSLHIAIAPTKNIDRIEFFIEKATEMGISEITLIQTEKTERKNINIDKLRKQSIAASKQSLRYHFPIINNIVRLSDFIPTIKPDNTFVAHCHQNLYREDLNKIKNLEKLVFLIGPEGDFSEREIQLLADHNIKAVNLGNQRLRTETAGIFVTAWNYLSIENL